MPSHWTLCRSNNKSKHLAHKCLFGRSVLFSFWRGYITLNLLGLFAVVQLPIADAGQTGDEHKYLTSRCLCSTRIINGNYFADLRLGVAYLCFAVGLLRGLDYYFGGHRIRKRALKTKTSYGTHLIRRQRFCVCKPTKRVVDRIIGSKQEKRLLRIFWNTRCHSCHLTGLNHSEALECILCGFSCPDPVNGKYVVSTSSAYLAQFVFWITSCNEVNSEFSNFGTHFGYSVSCVYACARARPCVV